MITVKPQSSLQHNAGIPIQLQCMVTGVPKPTIFWSLEQQEGLIMPGVRKGNMYMAQDGSLKIETPSVENSGQYVCTAINSVGSALARSHVVVYDPNDFNYNSSSAKNHETIYKDQTSDTLGIDEARMVLLERTVTYIEVNPSSSTSVRANWRIASGTFFCILNNISKVLYHFL